MAEYLRGKWWWIAYPSPNGGVKREPTKILNTGKDSRKLAEACYAKRLTEIAEGKFLGIKHIERIKFKDFAVIFINNHLKIALSTKWNGGYGDALRSNNPSGFIIFFGEKYLDEITPLDIEAFKQFRLTQEVEPSTINVDLTCLRVLFKKAILWEKLSINPMDKIKKFKISKKRDRYFTKEEFKLIIDYTQEPIRSMIIIAFMTGMRISEVLRLKWRDIDFSKNLLCIDDQKNKKISYIPVNHIKDVLMRIRRMGESEFVFNKENNTPYVSSNSTSKAFRNILNKLKIKGASFHTLRHSFASHLAIAGVDLYRISKLMRHSSIQMTERYAHLLSSHLDQATEVLSLQFDSILPSTIDNTKNTHEQNENENKEFKNIISQLDSIN